MGIHQTMTWLTETFTSGAVLAARQLNQLRDNFNQLALHRHTGASGEGSATLSGDMTGFPNEFSLWWYAPLTSGGTAPSYNYAADVFSIQNIGSYLTWKVGLRAGKWRLRFLSSGYSSNGIVRISLNSVAIIDIDLYSPSLTTFPVINVLFNVEANGWYDFEWRVIGQNPSSGSSACGVYHPFSFRRLT